LQKNLGFGVGFGYRNNTSCSLCRRWISHRLHWWSQVKFGLELGLERYT